jgi:hypothetical protein
MDYAFFVPALKFQTSLKAIRKQHPFVEEIAWMDMTDEVQELLDQIELLQGNKLSDYAIKLQNSRLELIFHALIQDISENQKEKLLFILSLRLKKRFFHYNWIMLQEHYSNLNLMESFHLLSDFMKNRYPEEFINSFASRMSFPCSELVQQALSVLKSEQCTLNDFFIRFGFLKKSALSRALLEEFFVSCNQDGFLENAQLFLDWIRTTENKPLPQIKHYLMIMDVFAYEEEINQLLIELFDLPGQSQFWMDVEEEYQTKFLEWTKLKDLGKYLGPHTEKFLFWKNYYQYIEHVSCYAELGILFLYLPGHVVIDFKKDKDQSFLYKKGAFQVAYRAFEAAGGFQGKTNWVVESEKIESMKSSILENRVSEIYELNYEGLGKLYIRDYLETIL